MLLPSFPRVASLVLLLAGHLAAAAPDSADWALGPFTRPEKAEPIIRPNPDSVFDCPMQGRPVRWEARHTFNPAAIARDGRICLLYRAEDDNGQGIGGFTSRLGLATSDDGIHFTKSPKPVLYPADDAQKNQEWQGGCEDPRVVQTEDGTYVLFYTQYFRGAGKKSHVNLGMATSRDLEHWEKIGPVVGKNDDGTEVHPEKSASLVTTVRDGRVVAAKINGRYWLYYGERDVRLLSSENLRDWTPAGDVLFAARPGKFDSLLTECGPPALLTARGIVLIYNGKNAAPENGGDPDLNAGVYSGGQALFDAKDPSKLLARLDHPFFRPELPWEKTGQYGDGTTFTEGLVLFKNRWFLYYGCADTFVGVAMADVKPAELSSAPAP